MTVFTNFQLDGGPRPGLHVYSSELYPWPPPEALDDELADPAGDPQGPTGRYVLTGRSDDPTHLDTTSGTLVMGEASYRWEGP